MEDNALLRINYFEINIAFLQRSSTDMSPGEHEKNPFTQKRTKWITMLKLRKNA